MKKQNLKFVALMALFMGLFSCANDMNDLDQEWARYIWDESTQQEEFRPVNPGTESSYFKIDNLITSFAVPNLVGTRASYSPMHIDTMSIYHPQVWVDACWCIILVLSKGTDKSNLSPVITLAPGVKLKEINYKLLKKNYSPITGGNPWDLFTDHFDHSGIIELCEYNFSYQMEFIVEEPDGARTFYEIITNVIDGLVPVYKPPKDNE